MHEAVDFYGVDLGVMQDEFDALAPKAPAAFDRRLYSAALGHANAMIDANSQDPACGGQGEPPCQLDRVGPAGFFFAASGLAAVATSGDLAPLVVVANYANANTAVGDHYDRFLVGTVWQDLDGDALYDPGEGRSGVVVSTDAAARFRASISSRISAAGSVRRLSATC